MFSSLQSRILLGLAVMVFISTFLMTTLVKKETVKQLALLQNSSAKNLVATALLNVESQYNSLQDHREALLTLKKQELKNIVDLAWRVIEKYHAASEDGSLSLKEAQRQAIDDIRRMRYGNGIGYVWINDTTRPFPRMIMHPTVPELDDCILDSESFNCVNKRGENLFAVALEVVSAKGAGYFDYQWPKPTQNGLTEKQAKLSYVSLFKPWGWIVGTGVYIDDIEREVDRCKKNIIEELRRSFSRISIGKSGYMYLFNGDQEMLIHPNLVGADFSKLMNPSTGHPILGDLIKAAQTPGQQLEYVWEKPPLHKGEYRFRKKSYIFYFKPLDWYIASSVYADEIEAPARWIARYILFLSLVILMISFVVSLWMARNLSKPLHLLSLAAQKVGSDNFTAATVPITGTVETRRLGMILNEMLARIREASQSRESLFQEKLELESKLFSARKLEAVGQLAAGIAHEINTPAQYVNSNLGFLSDALDDIESLLTTLWTLLVQAHEQGTLDEKLFQELEAAYTTAEWQFLKEEMAPALAQSEEGIRRITSIVSAMKNFSHPGSGKRELADINSGIESTVTIARNEWKYKAEMELLLDEKLPPVPCYYDELNQALLNMIINSVHAIEESHTKDDQTKGKITIQTARQGEWVEIRLSDTGSGMPDEVVDKIFDPFYTTKEQGKGTGQGLTIAHDVIVNKHQGTITVNTELGKGTTFVIRLPLN